MPVIIRDVEIPINPDRIEARDPDTPEREAASCGPVAPPPAEHHATRYYGVYPAVVTHVADPDAQGRVEISLPWAPDGGGSSGIEKVPGIKVWARLATLMAGQDRGSWFIPDVGDEVLVSFQAGDPSHPIVIGALWNGQDAPPHQMDGNLNNTRVLKSKDGNEIRMTDKVGETSISMKSAAGHTIELSDSGAGKIEIRDSSGASVVLEAGKLTINNTSEINLSSYAIKLSAGTVNIDAAMTISSGIVQCQTLVTNTVVSSSYTPGAGNIW